ncbi:alpha/beta fold hydrolase [Catellatospora tritici]|uniref:alpha/beta fold hydrolase n=1 Tax=Catellatospora tritici TaxID=2851566 RepID=UPI001C2D0545|nr:alpha/beta fold hydrolase [Catellatospora tritici]MBV1849958.1 alpha/beta fold hydrolase [Catellatospora tritici]
MSARTVEANGLTLWTDSFGDPADPCILLVMAAYWQGIAWPERFCGRLADNGFFVIRYDHRDTGRSSVIDYEQHPYTLADMADDAIGVLDAYGIERAHLVGASMGGMIVQECLLAHPERISTATSLMSTPLSNSYASGTSPENLPGPDPTAWKAFETVPGPGKNPSHDEYVNGWTDFSRGVAGSATPFDEQYVRSMHSQSYHRATQPAAVWNHLQATAATPDRTDRLAEVRTPTLVIHGTEDHVIPVQHGHATAALIPGAELVVIEGLGHQFDPAALDLVTQPLLRHATAEM